MRFVASCQVVFELPLPCRVAFSVDSADGESKDDDFSPCEILN